MVKKDNSISPINISSHTPKTFVHTDSNIGQIVFSNTQNNTNSPKGDKFENISHSIQFADISIDKDSSFNDILSEDEFMSNYFTNPQTHLVSSEDSLFDSPSILQVSNTNSPCIGSTNQGSNRHSLLDGYGKMNLLLGGKKQLHPKLPPTIGVK